MARRQSHFPFHVVGKTNSPFATIFSGSDRERRRGVHARVTIENTMHVFTFSPNAAPLSGFTQTRKALAAIVDVPGYP
jgi:hypothetical protein